MLKCKSRFISGFMCVVLILSAFQISVYATDSQASYVDYSGNVVYYYLDRNNQKYVIENGKKIYIAVPVSTEKVTNEKELEALKSSIDKPINTGAEINAVNILFSKTISLSYTTNVLTISQPYLYLKCSNLSPSGAKRGFSYYVFYSPDNSTWFRELYVNESLRTYTRHSNAHFGNGPYIKIHIWSYYGEVTSCSFNIKEASV